MLLVVITIVWLSAAHAMPDVSHLKNLKIQENREYLPPLDGAPTNTIESSTGYDYPRPSIPFPNEIETIYVPQKTQHPPSHKQPPKLIGSPSNISPTQVPSTLKPSIHLDYLPPVAAQLAITQRSPLVRTGGAETRIVSTTVRPFKNDYLPPFNGGGDESQINLNIIPSEPKLPTNEYLPPLTPTTTTTRRPTTPRPTTPRPRPTTTTRRPTTTTTTEEPFSSSYAPAANTPIPSVIKPVGPYFTKFDEENGYDYSKPNIGFDLPNNRVPVLNSADGDDDEDDENTYASASAPTNNVPIYTPSTSTTTEDSPPAPDVIYTPSHTLDVDGYRYKIPNQPFNY